VALSLGHGLSHVDRTYPTSDWRRALEAETMQFYVVLGYVWRVAVNVVELFVVLYIFYHLNARFEIIVIAVLGLIYTTIRTVAWALFHGLNNLGRNLGREFLYLQSLLGDQTVEERAREASEQAKRADRVIMKTYIDGFFISAIWIVCFYQLLANL
jgi:hypothetical protein